MACKMNLYPEQAPYRGTGPVAVRAYRIAKRRPRPMPTDPQASRESPVAVPPYREVVVRRCGPDRRRAVRSRGDDRRLMKVTNPDFDRLKDVLDAISGERDGMTVAELDGYMAAVIVCPEVILPSDWLAGVWDEDYVFADGAELEAAVAAVMGHYNRIAEQLAERPEEYAPVLETDPDSGETLWEPWIDGFELGMGLHPDAWEAVGLSDDEEATTALGMILALHELSHGRSELTEEAQDEFDRVAPLLIPRCVRELNAWTKSRHPATQGIGDAGSHAPFDRDSAPAFGRKVGRNESCPCGSGRKYKRCCGAR